MKEETVENDWQKECRIKYFQVWPELKSSDSEYQKFEKIWYSGYTSMMQKQEEQQVYYSNLQTKYVAELKLGDTYLKRAEKAENELAAVKKRENSFEAVALRLRESHGKLCVCLPCQALTTYEASKQSIKQ